MLDEIGEFAVKRTAMLALGPEQAPLIIEGLLDDGWSVATISAISEVRQHPPESVGCILLDQNWQPFTDELLTWCDANSEWRIVPKVLLNATGCRFAAVLPLPRARSAGELIESLVKAQRRYKRPNLRRGGAERRRHFRQKYSAPCFVQQAGRFLDLSIGGAAILLPDVIGIGTRLVLKINEYEPHLRAVQAEAISGYRRADGYHIHVKFVDMSVVAERALQRHLLALQIRDLQYRVR